MARLHLCTALIAAAALAQEPMPVFTRPSECTPPHGVHLSGRQDTTGMMVMTGGRVLFEYGNVVETSKVASVRKRRRGQSCLPLVGGQRNG